MAKYVLKRLLLMIPTLLIVAFAIFGLMSLTEIDPGRLLLGDANQLTQSLDAAYLRWEELAELKDY